MATLYDPIQLGPLALPNRIFMAPMTRNRAQADGVRGLLAATYYRQRASGGLVIALASIFALRSTFDDHRDSDQV